MLKRQFLADKQTCKVTFTFHPADPADIEEVAVVGDFNDWDAKANPMKRRGKNGTFSATAKLPCGRSYQFRYLINGSLWENDAAADAYVPTPFGDSDNSVLNLNDVSRK